MKDPEKRTDLSIGGTTLKKKGGGMSCKALLKGTRESWRDTCMREGKWAQGGNRCPIRIQGGLEIENMNA